MRPLVFGIVCAALAACFEAAPPEVGEAAPPCIRWSTEVRYRPFGYDHLVYIYNACDVGATCVVRTNVNPEPIQANVPPHSTVEVVTWVGSPSREFEAAVICDFHATM